ncbi:MAG: DUF5687 family protein [Flavobacterium sp.]
MFIRFLKLEWKAFLRSSAFGTNMVLKVFMILGALYFIGFFLLLGFGAFYMIRDNISSDPLVVVNKYLIYYFVVDLVIRLFLQRIPVINIRPLLTLPIKRSTIVNFAIGKSMVSFFNILHFFFFIPFTAVLINEGYGTSSLLWLAGVAVLVYCNNFLNTLLNNKDWLFGLFIAFLFGFGALQYYSVFDITMFTTPFYHGLYSKYYMVAIPVIALIALWVITFRYFKHNLYLDTGLKGKSEVAETKEYAFLNRFGTMGTFLKNDIKLILRNKRSKTTLLMSFLFLFYGLLFFTQSIEAYDNPAMKMFAGIFVSGGFMFVFGQFVPSWDSAYYPLMMSQNIKYREYIASKWWLVVVGTLASTILSAFYLYFGLDTYLIILSGAVFNIGVNSHLVLLGGAFIKTPIDLDSSKQAFGDKKAFNIKTMLISLPKMLVPMGLYAIGYYIFDNAVIGYFLVAGAGVLGFAFRNKVFSMIERIYKTEKYDTIAAYKQKS